VELDTQIRKKERGRERKQVMAAACGFAFTAAVTEKGKVCVWDWDDGCNGRDDWVADDNFVLIAAGLRHAACVAADGGLYTWGNGDYGQLGHGDEKGRRRPMRLCKEFLSSPAIMVACGDSHTLVLTEACTVLTCGYGSNGRLGHGDTVDKMRLQLVTPGVILCGCDAYVYPSLTLGHKNGKTEHEALENMFSCVELCAYVHILKYTNTHTHANIQHTHTDTRIDTHQHRHRQTQT